MRPGLIPRYNWDYGFRQYLIAVSGIFGGGSSADPVEMVFGPDVVMTSSGRASIYAILKCLDLPDGAGVGVPLYCCPVVFEAVREGGFSPVFIDSEKGGYNISAEDVRKKRHRLSALIVVHMFGHPAEMDEILKAAEGIPVIEDCAQALFSTFNGRMTGSISGLSFFSFRSGKYLSAGEGSFILAADPIMRERVKNVVGGFNDRSVLNEFAHCSATFLKSILYSRPWFGMVGHPLGRYLDRRLNLTSKSGFSAQGISHCDLSVIESRLKGFAGKVERQRGNALFLMDSLEGSRYGILREKPGCVSNFYQFPLRMSSREEKWRLSEYLFKNDIDSAPYLDDITEIAYQEFEYSGDCPFAEESSQNTLMVPHYFSLKEKDLNHIVEVLKRASRSI